MADPRTVPVIIGVADLRWGGAGLSAAPREPADLIGEATIDALSDTGVDGIGSRVDSIYAVKTASWSYDDLPALIARRIGADSAHTHTSSIGGHWPAALLDRIGSEIADGRSSVALLIGGEAQASLRSLTKSGTDPVAQGWLAAPGGPPTFTPDDLGSADMQRAKIFAPTRVYPLFENRLGYDLGLTPRESLRQSAEMYARFSEIAARHPAAWTPTVRTAADLTTVGPGNRLVSDAYPLTMNAMPFVDQAAAVVVCSLAAADQLGVDESRIVHLWGGAGATDAVDVLARKNFGDSPALTSAVDRTLERAGVSSDELTIIDAYSCFPVVPKLLLRALGLSSSVVPSVLGGHSFFGGPLNSYSLHSIAEVTRRLRTGPSGEIAMVHANGGYLTYQHAVVLSRTAHLDGYIGDPEHQKIPASTVVTEHDFTGDADIDTATVEYDRDGTPRAAVLIASTQDGRRIAGHTDAADAATLLRYTADGTRSLVAAPIHVTDRGGQIAVSLREEAFT